MQVTDLSANAAAENANGIPVEVTGEPAGLYRFYDAAGRLLYVGVSRNLASRWAQHESEKSWWPAVARKTVVMYGSRREAELAEGRAIRSESPLHNLAMGRKDKEAPKRAARKSPSTLRQQVEAAQLARSPQNSFSLDRKFLDRIDAYAKEHEVDRKAAFGILLITGIDKAEQDDAEYNTQRAALRAEIAELEAYRALAREVDGPAVGAGA